jgi:trigger factor
VAVTKEITRLEQSNVRLSITVPKDEVRVRYQDMLKDYTKDAQLPGFRKGHVPREVLERKFGEALKGEALSRVIEAAITEIFTDENLARNERPLPYSTPRVQDEPKLDLDQDLHFSVEYDVLPVVNVGQWKGLEVEVPDAAVTDEDIARELEEVRERNAIVLDRDDGAAAQTGDVATVDYCELGENGEVLSGTMRQDFVFTIGTGLNIYQIDDDIIGMKKGETKECTKTYDDTAAQSLAGQTKKLRITLTALKGKKLPDLDDELAQDVDEQFNTLDDLKNSIRDRMNKSLEQRQRTLKITALLEKVMETSPVTLPESMIRVELDGYLRNIARRASMPIEQTMRILQSGGEELEAIKKEWRPAAEKALHSRLIVETLMEEQKIEADDAEIEQELTAMAAENGITPEEYQRRGEEDEMREYLKDTIKERKLFDLLLAENTVKPGSRMGYMDFVANNG